MASYCTVEQLYERYDQRLIAQLSNDANSILDNTNYIQDNLDDATQWIKAAAIQGNAYTSLELDTLVASGETVLIRMCADVALRNMYSRRAQGMPQPVKDCTQGTYDLIDALRRGENVLAVEGRESARTPALVTTTANENFNLNVLINTDFFNEPTKTRTTDG